MICGSQRLGSVSLGVTFVQRTWQSSTEAERVRKSEAFCRIEKGRPPAVKCIFQQTCFGGKNRSGDESMSNPSRGIAVVQMYSYIITYKGQATHRCSVRRREQATHSLDNSQILGSVHQPESFESVIRWMGELQSISPPVMPSCSVVPER